MGNSETLTEQLTRSEMKFVVGENEFGTVLAQNYTGNFSDIEKALKLAGGKPKDCSLDDFSTTGKKQGKPEYIITFKDEPEVLIVIECKSNINKHSSELFNHPKDYAVDGALYYAKFLKRYYNVIAIGVSGTSRDKCLVSSYFWGKMQDKFIEYEKQRNFFLEPVNYIRLIKGEKIQKNYSLKEIKQTAIDIHESLRGNSVENFSKPVFIAALLTALTNKDFENNYNNIKPYALLVSAIKDSIKAVLKLSEVDDVKIEMIVHEFDKVTSMDKLKGIPLGEDNSLLWYLKQLDQKIIPMMNYSESTLDALGVFYHEFIKYSGSDGKGLGIVLTPQHLTEFMAELAGVNKSSKVVDICCGTGSFLVTAMGIMHKNASIGEWDKIRKENLYGVEQSPNHHLLALTNMIVRKDGKSNIYNGDCFDKKITKLLKDSNINIGLINPPYSLKGGPCELDFVYHLLNILVPSGIGVAVVPMSCAIGTKFKSIRNKLFQHHTLKAVFSLPDDIFSGQKVGTNVCVMVWEAHKKHDVTKNTFFGYYKEDGFVKAKKLGRIDKFERWEDVKKQWLHYYEDKEVKPGLTCLKNVNCEDEWLCEAYMDTDYSDVCQDDFEKTIKDLCIYQFNVNNISNIKNESVCFENIELIDINKWHDFKVSKIFKCSTTQALIDSNLEIGNCVYITRSALNNGCSGMKSSEEYETNASNCITIGAEGTIAFYQPIDFLAGVKVYTLRNEFLNKYNALFVCSMLNKNSYKYNYGRARVLKKIKTEMVRLPILCSENGIPIIDTAKKYSENGYIPDWKYMEKYIQSLPYSSNL